MRKAANDARASWSRTSKSRRAVLGGARAKRAKTGEGEGVVTADLAHGFETVDPRYGPVPFWWWSGEA